MYIIYEPEAREDMNQMYQYRYSKSIIKEETFIAKLIMYIHNLSIFPRLGKLILPDYNVRKLVYHKYSILYQINDSLNSIRIIKIVQPKQNIDLILKNIQKYL